MSDVTILSDLLHPTLPLCRFLPPFFVFPSTLPLGDVIFE